MKIPKDATIRILDAIFLACIFLFQIVTLNVFLINHYKNSNYPYLWFLGDFFCLTTFSFTLYQAHRVNEKVKKSKRDSLSVSTATEGSIVIRPGSRTSSQTSEYNWPRKSNCFNPRSKLPGAYMSWILYSLILIAKLIVLFKSEIPQHLKHSDYLGPQMIKFCIGITALIFSLLVEAHKDTHDDPLRNAYVSSISYGIALEILDSASFLSLLIGSESGLIYPFNFENFVIALSAINLMLPAICLYKLCVSDFGKITSSKVQLLEVLYKTLHLVLVNGSYLGVRIYLWSMFHTDTSIFIIKNIYAIVIFVREIPCDLLKLRDLYGQLTKINETEKLDEETIGQIKLNPLNPVLISSGAVANSD